MNSQYKYFAFISYSSKDSKWGKRLHRKLESYRMPATLCRDYKLNRRPIRPIFFAPYNIQPGGLAVELQERLEASKNLIVICSPNSAKSQWVGKEIEFFHSLGRTDNILFFIVEGQPHSGNEDTECINPIIDTLGLPEILGANINEKISSWSWINKERAYVQLITKLLGVEFDQIWRRHKWILIQKCFLLAVILIMSFSYLLFTQKRLSAIQVKSAISQMESLIQQDSLSKAYSIANMNILPYYHSLADYDKYRSEIALRKLTSHQCNIVTFDQSIKDFQISPDCKTVATTVGNKIIFWNINNGLPNDDNVSDLFYEGHSVDVNSLSYNPDGTKLLLTGRSGIYEYDISKKQIVNSYKMDSFSYISSSAEYSNDGHLFVYSNPLGNSLIFNTRERAPIDSISGLCPSFNISGNEILSIDRDNNHVVQIYNIETKQFKTFECPGNCLKTKYSIDNRYISVLCADHSVYLLDTSSGSVIGNSKPSSSNIKIKASVEYRFPGDMVFDGDGNFYYATDNNSDINCTCLRDDFSNIKNYHGHSRAITKLGLSKNGKFLLSLSDDNSIRVWKLLPSCMQVVDIKPCLMSSEAVDNKYSNISISPDGKEYIKIQQGGNMEIAFDYPETNSIRLLQGVSFFSGFSNDSRFLFCNGDNFDNLVYCDLDALKNNDVHKSFGYLQSSLFACANKEFIVTASTSTIYIYHKCVLKDSISIDYIKQLELPSQRERDMISALTICESNNNFYIGTQQGNLYVGGIDERETISLCGKFDGIVKSLSSDSNGKLLVCNIFNIQDPCYTQLMSSHGDVIYRYIIDQRSAMSRNVVFSQDGSQIFQTRNDGRVYTLSVPTFEDVINMVNSQ